MSLLSTSTPGGGSIFCCCLPGQVEQEVRAFRVGSASPLSRRFHKHTCALQPRPPARVHPPRAHSFPSKSRFRQTLQLFMSSFSVSVMNVVSGFTASQAEVRKPLTRATDRLRKMKRSHPEETEEMGSNKSTKATKSLVQSIYSSFARATRKKKKKKSWLCFEWGVTSRLP